MRELGITDAYWDTEAGRRELSAIVVPAVPDPETKLCRRCGEWRPTSAFSRNIYSSDGRAGWCKSCSASYSRAWRARKREAAGRG